MSPLPLALESLFKQATELRYAGDATGALRALDEIDARAGGPQLACDVIRGGILWELGRIDEGAVALRRVLALRPRHVLASRVLTHCLLEAGALSAARAEAARYLELVDAGEAARAPASLKDFYRQVVDASDVQLEGVAQSLRAEKQ